MVPMKKDPYLIEKFSQILSTQKALRLPAIISLGLFIYIGVGQSKTIWGIPKAPVFYACLIIIPSIILFHFVKWRCPACGKYLGRINPEIEKCPHCQVILQDKK